MSRFSDCQQRLLIDQNLKYVHWGDEDIIKGLSLFSLSPKGYDVVREQWLIPLPTGRTLQKYLELIPIAPDEPLPLVFQALNRQFIETKFDSLFTQCIMGLDEVAVDDRFCYDRKLDQVFGGIKYAAVYCARGLFNKSWKMPLQFLNNCSI
ncbi:unnamed protein product [Orchesella dallaii]|uniref:Uncharacterized protein n=1 Tax=Orchesella dallaii TaxID=48710 RepID=A0ABP1Q4G1_9HEXA